MTTSIEEAVRAAQERQADRAVDPGRIMARLADRRAGSVRRRRRGVRLAAAAAVVVAAVPAGLLIRPAAPAPRREAPAAVTPSIGPDPIALRYSPSWVPPGLVERDRQGAGERLDRRWTSRSQPVNAAGNDQSSSSLRVDVGPLSDLAARPPGMQAVDINGRPGFYLPPAEMAILKWQIDDRTVVTLTLNRVADPRTTLLHVARSMRSDAGMWNPPFELRAMPGGLSSRGLGVTGTGPADWLATASFSVYDTGVSPFAQVLLGTRKVAPTAGTSTTVAGQPARYGKTADGHYVVVELGQNRRLTVLSPNLTIDQMNALAARVEIAPTPDLAWLS